MDIKVIIENKLPLGEWKVRVKIWYVTLVDDMKTCMAKETKFVKLDEDKQLEWNFIANNYDKFYKIYVYLVRENHVYRYELVLEPTLIDINVSLVMGKMRPIVRVNDKSAQDLETASISYCNRNSSQDYEDKYIDGIIKWRSQPPEPDFCIIS